MDLAVQQLVDRLASRLRRPAVLEDRFFRLVAYSVHDEPIDEVRESSILRRHASADVSRWLTGFGIRNARGPVRVPGNPELHMLPRVCFPIRHRNLLLGYLWFVDADERLTAAEIDGCADDLAELGTVLHQESVASVPTTERVGATVRALLSDSRAAASAATELEDEGLINAAEGVVVVVQVATGDETTDSAVQESFIEVVLGASHVFRRGSALYLPFKDHTALVLASPERELNRLRSQLESLRDVAEGEVAASTPAAGLVVGVGGHCAELADAHASYVEARMAAMAAAALPSFPPVVAWSELGAYQLAAKLATRGESPLHDGLRHLLDSPDALPLLETLETYLDYAGNAQVTAEALHLHRTSLYYRLQRVEHLARTDLKDGMERLALHLSLKVARLTGQYVPTERRGSPTDAERADRRAGPGSEQPVPRLQLATR